jgi:thermitase
MTNPMPDSSLRDPVLEGFSIETVEPGQEALVRAAVTEVLGPQWHVFPFGRSGTDYEATGGPALTPAQAWDLTYALRARPGIAFAEPLFAVRTPEEEEAPTRGPAGFESFGGESHEPGSDPVDWSVKLARVDAAWKRFEALGRVPGEGVVIGHPDTGYRRHPVIDARLLLDRDRDFLEGDDDAQDDLRNPGHVVLHHPSHGTATASVIVGAGASPDGKAVMGVAPGAKLIPLRVSRSVVLVSMLNLARAIEYAADQGAHVISISMGGLGSSRLRKAVLYAQRKGVIVLCAAGNKVRFVVWPAAYEEVVAVAACNAALRPWSGSSRGRAVDVTGPGESVWRAQTELKGANEAHSVARGSGTSYAVATVAGVAALWLSYHGPEKLAQRFGAEKIPFIFNRVLRATCVAQPAWGKGFGYGLVDADAVLAAPLTDGGGGFESVSVNPAPNLGAHPPIDNGGADTFAHLFGGAATESGFESLGAERGPGVTGALAELLDTAEQELPERLRQVGQEVAFHLATDPSLYRQFEEMRAGGGTRSSARAELLERGSSQLRQRTGSPDGGRGI